MEPGSLLFSAILEANQSLNFSGKISDEYAWAQQVILLLDSTPFQYSDLSSSLLLDYCICLRVEIKRLKSEKSCNWRKVFFLVQLNQRVFQFYWSKVTKVTESHYFQALKLFDYFMKECRYVKGQIMQSKLSDDEKRIEAVQAASSFIDDNQDLTLLHDLLLLEEAASHNPADPTISSEDSNVSARFERLITPRNRYQEPLDHANIDLTNLDTVRMLGDYEEERLAKESQRKIQEMRDLELALQLRHEEEARHRNDQ